MAVKTAPRTVQDATTVAKHPAREARAEAESGSGGYGFLARADQRERGDGRGQTRKHQLSTVTR